MKNYFKRLWNALWASTDLDERAVAAIKEAKARIAEMKKELADVKNAAKNTIAQAKDVADAAKGKKDEEENLIIKIKRKKRLINTFKKRKNDITRITKNGKRGI